MSYEIIESRVETSYLAAVRAVVTRRSLGATIRQILGENLVYRFVVSAGLQKVGHNVIVYNHDLGKASAPGQSEFEIEVGVQVAGQFEGSAEVVCSSTPQGRALTTTRTGPYDKLGLAHNAVMKYAREHALPLTGRSWEIYGDFNPDPNQTITQVFYLLK